MNTLAVVLEQPRAARAAAGSTSTPPGDDDVVVDIDWSGISTGTERLLWSGRMPPFPGMGYPLVPGYESVGRVRDAGARSGARGRRARLRARRQLLRRRARPVRRRRVRAWSCPARAPCPSTPASASSGVLLALAATAYHALRVGARRGSPI